MTQTINNQVTSLMVQKNLNPTKEKQGQSIERLSSGVRVKSAKDDAAELAILERTNSELRGMHAGIRNAYDGISISQVADSGLQQVSDKLQRMRELALQSANGNYSSSDRENLNRKFRALNEGIAHIAATTQFNGGSVPASNVGSAGVQIEANAGAQGSATAELASIKPLNVSISTVGESLASISRIDAMIASVASSRASFEVMQTQFESTINNLQDGVENRAAAPRRFGGADVALEAAMFTRSQIVEQSGLAISSQANVDSQRVKQLLA